MSNEAKATDPMTTTGGAFLGAFSNGIMEFLGSKTGFYQGIFSFIWILSRGSAHANQTH
jgi:hypothetical protein